MKQKVLDQYQSSPHSVHDETKSFGSTPSPHALAATAKNQNDSLSQINNFKVRKTRNMLEIAFLCILNMLNFKRLALIATEM